MELNKGRCFRSVNPFIISSVCEALNQQLLSKKASRYKPQTDKHRPEAAAEWERMPNATRALHPMIRSTDGQTQTRSSSWMRADAKRHQSSYPMIRSTDGQTQIRSSSWMRADVKRHQSTHRMIRSTDGQTQTRSSSWMRADAKRHQSTSSNALVNRRTNTDQKQQLNESGCQTPPEHFIQCFGQQTDKHRPEAAAEWERMSNATRALHPMLRSTDGQTQTRSSSWMRADVKRHQSTSSNASVNRRTNTDQKLQLNESGCQTPPEHSSNASVNRRTNTDQKQQLNESGCQTPPEHFIQCFGQQTDKHRPEAAAEWERMSNATRALHPMLRSTDGQTQNRSSSWMRADVKRHQSTSSNASVNRRTNTDQKQQLNESGCQTPPEQLSNDSVNRRTNTDQKQQLNESGCQTPPEQLSNASVNRRTNTDQKQQLNESGCQTSTEHFIQCFGQQTDFQTDQPPSGNTKHAAHFKWNEHKVHKNHHENHFVFL